jgi:hypothetical protein
LPSIAAEGFDERQSARRSCSGATRALRGINLPPPGRANVHTATGKETTMVRSAGGKRITHDKTKALVRSHVATQPGRHARTDTVPATPKAGKASKAAKGRNKG